MNNEDFDEFLQQATLTVHQDWCDSGGRELNSEELQQLNGLLDLFFASKREG